MPLCEPILAHRSLVVGLTGGIGTGKSAVANLFLSLGVSIIDTDIIAHELTRADGMAMPAILKEFGTDYVDQDGALDRAAMRSLVFNNPKAKETLEGILHPMINSTALSKLNHTSGVYSILVVPLLIEFIDRYKSVIDRIVVVDCEEAIQLNRVVNRGLDEKTAKSIMLSQVSRAKRLAFANDVIDNNGDVATLTQQVLKLHQYYSQLTQENPA
jgi:dephospho-CoA kinase